MKQILKEFMREINNTTVVKGVFTTSHTRMARTRQKTTKGIEDLNSTIDQLDTKYIHRTVHLRKAMNRHVSQVSMEYSPGSTMYEATKQV